MTSHIRSLTLELTEDIGFIYIRFIAFVGSVQSNIEKTFVTVAGRKDKSFL